MHTAHRTGRATAANESTTLESFFLNSPAPTPRYGADSTWGALDQSALDFDVLLRAGDDMDLLNEALPTDDTFLGLGAAPTPCAPTRTLAFPTAQPVERIPAKQHDPAALQAKLAKALVPVDSLPSPFLKRVIPAPPPLPSARAVAPFLILPSPTVPLPPRTATVVKAVPIAPKIAAVAPLNMALPSAKPVEHRPVASTSKLAPSTSLPKPAQAKPIFARPQATPLDSSILHQPTPHADDLFLRRRRDSYLLQGPDFDLSLDSLMESGGHIYTSTPAPRPAAGRPKGRAGRQAAPPVVLELPLDTMEDDGRPLAKSATLHVEAHADTKRRASRVVREASVEPAPAPLVVSTLNTKAPLRASRASIMPQSTDDRCSISPPRPSRRRTLVPPPSGTHLDASEQFSKPTLSSSMARRVPVAATVAAVPTSTRSSARGLTLPTEYNFTATTLHDKTEAKKRKREHLEREKERENQEREMAKRERIDRWGSRSAGGPALRASGARDGPALTLEALEVNSMSSLKVDRLSMYLAGVHGGEDEATVFGTRSGPVYRAQRVPVEQNMASEPATSKAPTLGDSKTMHASRGAVPFAEVSNTRPAKTSASQERTWDIETTSIKLLVESNARLAERERTNLAALRSSLRRVDAR